MTAEPGRSQHRAAQPLLVDDEQVTLPGSLEPDRTYDVLLNGRHVWSLQPDQEPDLRAGEPTGDLNGVDGTADAAQVVAWPPALRRFLRGRAEVVLRDHVSEAVVGTTHHVFRGRDDKEVDVTDRQGRELVLDKWGRLIRPLASEDDDLISELVDEVVTLLEVLRDEAGVPAYICYGTLLGAVRDGELIGHDNDVDVAYVSEHPFPVDVVRESYRVERTLLEHGYFVRRGSGVRLNVRLRLSDDSMRFVDVFTSHWVEGRFYIPSDTGFELPRETILPLTTVGLHGHQVPAPARSEELLAATYGPGWRVPDPSFRYVTPRWLSRRLGGWFGGLMTHRKHWDAFAPRARRRLPKEPTSFARWVADRYPSDRPLVELGSGTGRDGRWFAQAHSREVTGIDYSVGAVRHATRLAEADELSARFEVLNLYDLRAVLTLGAKLSRRPTPVDLYCRFTLHALDTPGQDNVFRLASMALRRGGLLFLEFRTPEDRGRYHVWDDHARHYVDPVEATRRIEDTGGLVVDHVEGTGLAPFRDEDPYVCRLVAQWSAAQWSAT